METWICCFTAQAQTKNFKDHKVARGENKNTDLFLALAGCEAHQKDLCHSITENWRI